MRIILVASLFAGMYVGPGILFGQAQTTTPASATAAPQTPAPTKDPVTASLRMLLPRSRNNILGAITAMPADKFTYKPTPEQMSFAHLVVHIIGSNNSMCARAADIAEPKVEEAKESDAKDKLLAAATASFDVKRSTLLPKLKADAAVAYSSAAVASPALCPITTTCTCGWRKCATATP